MDSHCEASPTAATGGTPALQGGVLADAVLQRVDHLPARDLEHHDLSVARRRGGAAGPGVGFPPQQWLLAGFGGLACTITWLCPVGYGRMCFCMVSGSSLV